MKKILAILITGMFFLIGINSVAAQSNKNAMADFKKVLVDTTLLTAVEVTLAPGQKTDQHTHPAHCFYALTDCKLHVKYADGKVEDWDVKAGESGFGMPEGPHVTQNTGKNTAKFLIVELKEHPYMMDKKMK